MRASAVSAIIMANSGDQLLGALTDARSIASVPFGARYRVVDFTLSSLVNAGISNIGIVTKENYRSLMDHVGNGVYWDLDRKNGGLKILPPFMTAGVRKFTCSADALFAAKSFIENSKSDYIVLCDGNLVANVDIQNVLNFHIANDADLTVVYAHGKTPKSDGEIMQVFHKNGFVTAFGIGGEGQDNTDFCVGVTVVKRETLLNLIDDAYENRAEKIGRDIFAKNLENLKVCAFEHREFFAILDSMQSYFKANMQLLNKKQRGELFSALRPIYTKTRDDMPTRYGMHSKVTNSIIADGCVLEGNVNGSVVSRGVRLGVGASVKNCIIMQGALIGENCVLENVIIDKNAIISNNTVLKGTKTNSLFVLKNQVL